MPRTQNFNARHWIYDLAETNGEFHPSIVIERYKHLVASDQRPTKDTVLAACDELYDMGGLPIGHPGHDI